VSLGIDTTEDEVMRFVHAWSEKRVRRKAA
jgi:cysteine desulfurase